MAKFYAQAQGNRGLVHCMGSEASGIWTSAQSYDGSVITRLWYDSAGNLMVQIQTNDSSSTCGQETLFSGSFLELKERLLS